MRSTPAAAAVVVGLLLVAAAPRARAKARPVPAGERAAPDGGGGARRDVGPRGDERPSHLVTPWGMSVSVGVGVVDFTGDAIGGAADAGSDLDVRIAVGTRRFVAIEGAVRGTTHDVHALGLDGDARLVSRGLELGGRVNLGEVAAADVAGLRVAPFLLGGVGLARYELVDEGVNRSNLRGADTIVALPVGVGLGGGAGALVMDARLTYRRAVAADLLAEPGGGDDGLDSWNLSGRVGIEF